MSSQLSEGRIRRGRDWRPSFAHAEAPTEINFGVISTEASVNQKKNWEPFVEAMSKAIGIKVKAFYATDYAGVIEAMRFNKVHVAWYGNKSGMEAVDRADGEVFAQVVVEGRQHRLLLPHHRPRRQPVHQGRRHPEVRQVAQFRHRRSELDLGLPGADLLHLRRARTSIRSPASRRCATPAIRPTPWRWRTSRSMPRPTTARTCSASRTTAPEARKQIKVIWTSPIIPLDPLVWRKDLDPAIKTKLYTFLMSYGRLGSDEEIKRSARSWRTSIWSPFHPSSDRQLIPIRKLEANKDLMKVQGDDKLSDAEKQRRSQAQGRARQDRADGEAGRDRSLSEAGRGLHRGREGRRQGRDEEDDRGLRRRLRQHELMRELGRAARRRARVRRRSHVSRQRLDLGSNFL